MMCPQEKMDGDLAVFKLHRRFDRMGYNYHLNPFANPSSRSLS